MSERKDTRVILTIGKRADFLAANRGRRMAMPGFVLLVHERGDGDPAIRLGITVTKKIGGAVVRNRMKRRFRALARDLLPDLGRPGADHVLIGRAGGVEREFGLLREELVKALRKLGGDALLRKQETRSPKRSTRDPGLLPSQERGKRK